MKSNNQPDLRYVKRADRWGESQYSWPGRSWQPHGSNPKGLASREAKLAHWVATNVRKEASVVVPVDIGEGPNQMSAKVQGTEIWVDLETRNGSYSPHGRYRCSESSTECEGNYGVSRTTYENRITDVGYKRRSSMRPIRRNEMSGMRAACDIVNRVAITWRGAYRTSLVFIRNRRMRLALRRRTYGGVAMRC